MMSKSFKVLLLTGLVASCADQSETIIYDANSASGEQFAWPLRADMPAPRVPDTNPMTAAKVELGRYLFYDQRLSGNGTQSCASCHEQELAFSDGRALAIGSTGELHPRNAQGLINVAYNASYTWANPSLLTLEQQIMIPLFGTSPIEQGLNDENLDTVLQRLRDESRYDPLFEEAFASDADALTVAQIVDALASFVRSLISFESPYDRYLAGDASAMSPAALRGRDLFFSESLECFHCHGGYNFSDSTLDRTMSFVDRPFHNTGLFNLDGEGAFPENNQGIFEITGKPQDMGKFRAVTLRNIALTAPYMHDGSIATLDEVIDFYAAGGRLIENGPLAGDGRKSPLKDGFVTGFSITASEKSDLIEFLNSLTDESITINENFANPW